MHSVHSRCSKDSATLGEKKTKYEWLARWFLLGSSGDLASFPGRPTVQFLIACSVAEMEGESLVHFIT